MASAPPVLLVPQARFLAPSAPRPRSSCRPSPPEPDENRAGRAMREEKSYCCRGAAGDQGSCPAAPPAPGPAAAALLLPADEPVASGWPRAGGGVRAADEDESRLLQLVRAAPEPSEAFRALQAALPRRAGRLGLPRRKEALYRALGRVLAEGGPEEKRLGLQLVADVLRGQGEAAQLEEAFSLAALPQLVGSLREDSPALRKDALQILHQCWRRSPGPVLQVLVQRGLESADARLRAATALLLPVLFSPAELLLGLDLTELTLALARRLGEREEEEEAEAEAEAEAAFSALQQIGERLGQERFQSYMSRLPSALRRRYSRRAEAQPGGPGPRCVELEARELAQERLRSPAPLQFGVLPQQLHSRLLDQEDYKSRSQAVEELKQALARFRPASAPHASLLGLVSLLYNLLDDSNFKVVHGALQALHVLVGRLGEQVQRVLGPVIAATVKVLADNKLVMKQEYLKIFLKLMEQAGPQRVLAVLLEHLKHKHSRVREEVLNVSICSLLTYPTEDFDLPTLAFALAPALVDSKRRVRQAALEAFAVLASAMGSGKTSVLFRAVDTVELEDNGDGVLSAVQARLARKTLPRLTEQGFVEYATLMPSSAQGRSSHLPHGADTDWLLAGNRTQSAHCHGGDHSRDSVQIHGSYSPSAEQTICTRRVLSAGKGKNKLPWENDQPGGLGENRTSQSKEIEQFSAYDFIPPPKLRPSQEMPVSDDLCFSRKRVSRNLFQNSLDFNPEPPHVYTGTAGSHQTSISGKCGQLGFSQTSGQSGSVDSGLQFLGANNSRQDKVCASLSFGSKTQQTFGSSAEHTLSYPSPNTSQGALILPSYPLSSPRTSPKHTSPLNGSPKKSQDNSVNFSNSWPLKSFEGLPKPSPQKKLFGQKSVDASGENSQEKPSPIQLKPALVRSPSSRRGLNGTKPVPPIPRGISLLPDKADFITVEHEKKDHIWRNEKDNLGIDLSELNVRDKESDQEEMQSSLRSLRNSAAKKRAKLSGSTSDLESPDSAIKLDLTMDSPSRSSSPNISSYSESGVYSQESLTSSLSTTPQGKRIMADIFPTFGSKPYPTRPSSAKNKNSPVVEQSSNSGITSNVSIIGQRMNYGYGCGDFEDDKLQDVSPGVFKMQNREHLKHYKHTKGFTGSSNLQQISNFDFTSTNALSEDSVVVVGKGVFGITSSVPVTSNPSVIPSVENGDTFSIKPSIEPPSGIYGRAVQQNNLPYLDVENEKDIKASISKSTYDKMRQKRKEEKEISHKELFEVKDHEKKEHNPRERIKHPEAERMATENLSIFGDEVVISGLSLESIAFSPSSKGVSYLKRSPSLLFSESGEVSAGTRAQYKERIPSVTHSPEIMDPSELRPFSKPEVALSEALRLLADDDWEKKIEGLNFIRCLSAFHSDVLTVKLHETSLAVVQEVKNLRSGVSRAAVVCVGDLFTHLKKNMDQEIDNTVKVLLHKAGESNTFIREDVDKALKAMVTNVTPARAASSLINGGQSHLHIAVRRCAAQHLCDVVEQMEPERILSGTKDLADRILPAAAKFAQDSSQETRYYGRKMLFLMMSHPNFDKMLEKYVPCKDLLYIKESVKNLRQKGLGEIPLDTPSAKGRRSHASSVGSTRSSSVSRDVLSSAEREIMDIREIRKTVPRSSLESAEYVKVITGLLNAKDFRDRINGIKQLLSDTENNQELVVGNIVKICDAFKSRLHDSNSKVNLIALETMHKMIPLLRDNLSPVINMLIPAIVDNNLNSKNPGIYAAATNVIHALSQHIDNYLLLQPFCTKAQFLNGKAKQDMTEKLADLVMDLYQRKPHAIEQKVLAVLWHLLGNMTNSGSLPGAGGNIRAATAKLSKALFAQMGPSLLNQAACQPPQIKRSLEELLEMTT